MERPTDSTFRPRPLRGRDLRGAVNPGLRRFSAPERQAELARRAALCERLSPWSRARRRQMALGALGGAVYLPLFSTFLRLFSPVPWAMILWQVPLGALFGALVKALRARAPVAGPLLLVTAFLAFLLAGYHPLAAGPLLLYLVYFTVGCAVGFAESVARADGG